MATPTRSTNTRRSPRAGTKPQAGDATGRQKAQQMAEAAPAINEAALSMSLMNVPDIDEEPEVMDYSQGAGQGVRAIDPAEFEALLDDDTESDPDDDYNEPEDNDPSGYFPDGRSNGFEEEPVELDEPPAKHGRPGQRKGVKAAVATAPVVAEKAFKMMRVNEDLDNVTIGKDPVTGDLLHYSFRVGTRYKVPMRVYTHLDRIGYVYH